MEDLTGKGERSSQLRRTLEANWDKIIEKLGILPSRKQATIDEKITYALQSLNEYPNARHHLIAVATEVVGHEHHKGVLELIEGVELKSLPQNDGEESLLTSSVTKQHYGATEHAFSKKGMTMTMGHSRPCTSHRALVITTVSALLLLLVTVVSITVLALVYPSQSGGQRVQVGDTVMLAKAKSSWYREFVVRESLDEGDSDHVIDGWVLLCASLKERSRHVTFKSRSLYLYYETFLLGEQPSETPIYLLTGSQITYSFFISANITLSAKPEFFIFDSEKAFRSFINGKVEGVKSAIYHQELAVGTPQNPALTELSYMVQHNGYYYMTGYSEPGISYQFNATEHVLYLNTSDFRGKYPTCQFSSGQTCSFVTDNSFLGSNEEYCLITHINQPYSEDPPSTHIEVETKKRYEVLLLPGVVAVVGVILLVVSGIVISVVVVRKRVRHRYTRIQ